jgi:ATP-dependent RNA helicase DDX19/DBP5
MRKTATDLTKRMIEAGHAVSLLHGGEDMSSQERDRVIDDFRDARTKVLITTNVLARGIDILQVMLVINYDLPLDGHNKVDAETYLHRIGRSGRFGRKGIAINFVADEKSKDDLKALHSFFGKPIDELKPEQIETLQAMLEKLQEDEKQAILDTPDDE